MSLQGRRLALLHHPLAQVDLRLLVCLLDQGRVDSAVRDQPLERDPRDLPANAVEAGQHDGGRRLVDDHVDARQLFERADVPALTADDAALHLVRRQLHQASGRFARVLGGQPSGRDGQDVAGPPVALALGLVLDLADLQRSLVLRLLLDIGEEHLLRLRGAQARDALQLKALDPLGLLQLLVLLGYVAFAVLQRLHAPVDVRLTKGDGFRLSQRELFHPGDLRPPGLELVDRTSVVPGVRRRSCGALGGPPVLVLAAPAEALRALSHVGFTSTRTGDVRQRARLSSRFMIDFVGL